MNKLSSDSGKRFLPGSILLLLLVISALWTSRLDFAETSSPRWVKARYACNNNLMTEEQIAAHRGISVETLHLLQTQRGLSNESICVLPEDKLARAINRATNPKPDRPDDALAFRLLQLRDENGLIPADGLSKAAEHIELMQSNELLNADGAGISPGDWTWLGPGNIGGRIRSIVIHPTNPNQMWVGSVSGGIWTTSNGGTSWQPVNDFMANLAVSALVMQPGNPSIMYAGTGEGFYNVDGIQGAGVFKSTNGGAAWTQLAATADANWYYVNRLAISPNGSVILAATGSGIWRSTNGGTSWTQTLSDWRVKDIDFHPTNNSNAIASGSEGAAWYSVDGGINWNLAGGLPVLDWLGRVEVTYAPNNPTTVYASVSQNSGEIWRSTNGGQTYSLRNTGNNYLGSQGWYDNIIWVDPTNANNLIVGGIDLWRSTNGGSTLTQISQWWMAPSSAHADHHAIVAHPGFNGGTNTTVYFGNDGGIYRANNVYTVIDTSGWQELNNNLGITQFYGATGNTTSGIIIGGTQDNGTLRYAGNSETWTTMFGGDGGWNAADPTDPNFFYGEYTFLQIHRSNDAGISSNYIYDGIGDAGLCANFIAPFILDPNNANTMLAGGCSLWRSTNVKAAIPTWNSIKSPSGDNISAIAVAKGNSSIIWVGHNDGSVYKTSNGTVASPTWVRVDNNSPGLPDRFVTRLTIDPNNHNTVYATFGGFSADNVWRTTNGGTNWTDRTGNGGTGLPDAPVRSLVTHPADSNWIYVGTEVGIFASEDGGSTWSLPHDGPANVSVDELFWMNSNLVAATHGRGLFQAPVGTNPTFTLTVNKTGAGSGTVTSSPPGINCGSDCSEDYPSGTVVTLTASAGTNSTFTGWSGAGCSGTGTCVVTMNAATTVTANFDGTPPLNNLLGNPSFEVDANNDGRPDVWSTNAKFTRSTGIVAIDGNYVGRFLATDNSGVTIQQVVLNLTAGGTYNFSGQVNIPSTSDAFTFKIQVKWRNSSNNVITTSVVKTYTASTSGWNEAMASLVAPAGTTNALVQMVVTNLNATIYVDKFSFGGSTGPVTYNLTVTKSGNGSGTVTSNPAGISCGVDCLETYNSGTQVILSATADGGSTFTGWSGGGCSGAGTCTVTLTGNTTINADFITSPVEQPDLIIQSITPVPANPSINQAVGFSVVIKNQGSADATGFWVDLFIDTPFPPVCSGASPVSQHVPSLAAGATQTLTLNYAGFGSDGVYPVNGIVDTNCNVNESNENNNMKSINISVGPPGQSIFDDGFESCDLSAWSPNVIDGGDLSAGSPGLVGNCSLRALIDDNNAIYVTSGHPDAETRYKANFYFDPNSIPMVNGDTHTIFGGYSGTSTLVLRLQFRRSSNLYQVQAALLNDGSSFTTSSWFTISDAPHQLALDWQAATAAGANNGALTLSIDGTQQANLIGVDNDTRRIDLARLGAIAGIDAGTRGTYYFDEFKSSRGDTPPPASVSVVGAFTADGNWNPKTTFVPGDPIQWILEVQNETGQDAQIELTFDVRDPNGAQITVWNGIVTTGPGLQWWGLPGTVQSGPDGIHTIFGSGLYQGTLSETSATYTVSGGDPIFADSFESDDCTVSPWSACIHDNFDLSFNDPSLASPGNQSMTILIDDNNALHVTSDHPNGESRYRARFYFDPNSIPMVSGNAHFIFYGYNGTSKAVLRVEFRNSSGNYQLRAALLTDSSSWNNSSWFTITDAPHPVEIDWRASTGAGANNGGLTLWIDGIQKADLTGVDNDTWRIDLARLGAVAGIDAGTRGTYYFDAFDSRKQSYIGPLTGSGPSALELGPVSVPSSETPTSDNTIVVTND